MKITKGRKEKEWYKKLSWFIDYFCIEIFILILVLWGFIESVVVALEGNILYFVIPGILIYLLLPYLIWRIKLKYNIHILFFLIFYLITFALPINFYEKANFTINFKATISGAISSGFIFTAAYIIFKPLSKFFSITGANKEKKTK